MRHIILFASIPFFLLGCKKSNDTTTDILAQAKSNPSGTWRVTLTADGQSATFTVTSDRIDHGGFSYFKVSPTTSVFGMNLGGILVADNGGKTYVVWLEDQGGGSYDTESSMVLSTTGNTLVLGGDFETYEISRLEKIQ